MTYEGPHARATNRVLILLVVITIAFVAFWAASGGFDEIAIDEAERVSVSE